MLSILFICKVNKYTYSHILQSRQLDYILNFTAFTQSRGLAMCQECARIVVVVVVAALRVAFNFIKIDEQRHVEEGVVCVCY